MKRPRDNATPPPPNSNRRVTRRKSASPGPHALNNTSRHIDLNGKYTIQAWEGRAMGSGAVMGLAKQFAKLCKRPNSDIQTNYTADVLMDASQRPTSSFVVAAVHSAHRYIAALAHCTLHSGMPGIAPRKVVFIDLVCSDVRRKGIGAVLMTELETYARDTLGAQALVLQSVLNPSTQYAYYSKGFERGVGNRSAATVNRAREAFRALNTLGNAKLNTLLGCATGECRKRLAAHLNSVHKNTPGVRPTAAFKAALRGEYYPAYNTLYSGGNSFVMTKHLTNTRPQHQPHQPHQPQHQPWSLLGALWPQRNNAASSVVSWGRGNGHASFRVPGTIRTLAEYTRNRTTKRLVRIG